MADIEKKMVEFENHFKEMFISKINSLDITSMMDYSSFAHMMILYLDLMADMFKNFGHTTSYMKVHDEMKKCSRMLQHALNYEENVMIRESYIKLSDDANDNKDKDLSFVYDLVKNNLVVAIGDGRIFRPGKTSQEKLSSWSKQQQETMAYVFAYIGKRILRWWD